MATFIDMVLYLQSWGLLDVLIPFLLVFTLVFAILQNVKVFGPNSKRYNVIIGLAMGFAVVVPHLLWGTPHPNDPYLVTGFVDIVKVINNSLPQVSVVIIAVLMVLLMIGLLGVKLNYANKGGVVVIAAIIVVLYIFGTNAGWFFGGQFPWFLWWLVDPATQALLITILIFGVIIWFITRDEKKTEGSRFFPTEPIGGGQQ